MSYNTKLLECTIKIIELVISLSYNIYTILPSFIIAIIAIKHTYSK